MLLRLTDRQLRQVLWTHTRHPDVRKAVSRFCSDNEISVDGYSLAMINFGLLIFLIEVQRQKAICITEFVKALLQVIVY